MLFHFEKVPAIKKLGDFTWKLLFCMTFQTVMNSIKSTVTAEAKRKKGRFFLREKEVQKLKRFLKSFP